MTQAGLPLAAYEALQLHPGAPRDLVERAYWHLAAIQQRLPDSRTVTEELQRLNMAYYALVDPSLADKRAVRGTKPAAARKQSSTPWWGLWFGNRGPETTSDGRTNHEVLFVATDAHREIIDLAHAWRTTQLKGRRNGDAAEYDLVNHAYAALCDNPTEAPPAPDPTSAIETLQPAISNETDPTAANVAPPDAKQAETASPAPAPTPKTARPVDPAVRRLTDLVSKVNDYAANGITPPALPPTALADALPAAAASEPLAPASSDTPARESSTDPLPELRPEMAPLGRRVVRETTQPTIEDAASAPAPATPIDESAPRIDAAPVQVEAAADVTPVDAAPPIDDAVPTIEPLPVGEVTAPERDASPTPLFANRILPADTPAISTPDAAAPDEHHANNPTPLNGSAPAVPAHTANEAPDEPLSGEHRTEDPFLTIVRPSPIHDDAVPQPSDFVKALAAASTMAADSTPEPLPEPAEPSAPGLLRTFFSRLRTTVPVDDASPPKSKRELAAAAEHSRLMTLRSDRSHTEAWPPAAAAPAERIQRVSLARLTFVAGLRAGESVPVYDEPMSLGTNPRSSVILPDEHGVIAREHARLWRQGESFLFREVDGESTIVGGDPLTLPVVVLEDQDEIAIGDNIMRFTRADAPQQADAESSSAAAHQNARPA